MPKLDLGVEHLGTGADAPGDDRLEETARLDGLTDGVLFNTTHLGTVRGYDVSKGVWEGRSVHCSVP